MMGQLIKRVNKKDFICIIILFFFIFLSAKALFHDGFFRTVDDITTVRIIYLEKELKRNNWFNNFPVRISGELSNNFSYPLYLFYAPLTYYAGVILKLLFSFSYIVATKYVYLFPLIFGPIAFYFAARQKMRPFPALIASIFFALFPYRGFNTYIRGAVAEAWAISFIPLCFAGVFLLEKKKPIGGLIFALSLFLILISHNIVGFLFLEFIVVYGLIFFGKNKRFWQHLLLGLSMAAFFLIPMLYYLKFVRVTYLDVNKDYILKTLAPFSKIFNLGINQRANIGEELLVNISGILLLILLASFLFYIYQRIKAQKITQSKEKFFWLISALVFYLLLFQPFAFFWKLTMPLTGIMQFSWRLLSLNAFIIPFILGLWLNDIKNLFFKIIISVIAVLACLNFLPNFAPEAYSYFYEYRPEGACATTSNQDEYLPIWVKGCPEQRIPLQTTINDEIKIIEDKSLLIKAVTTSSAQAELIVNKFYFPGWHILIDGKDQPLDYTFSIDGIFKTALSAGTHQIEVVYQKTLIMWLSDLISFVSFCLFFYYLGQVILVLKRRK